MVVGCVDPWIGNWVGMKLTTIEPDTPGYRR